MQLLAFLVRGMDAASTQLSHTQIALKHVETEKTWTLQIVTMAIRLRGTAARTPARSSQVGSVQEEMQLLLIHAKRHVMMALIGALKLVTIILSVVGNAMTSVISSLVILVLEELQCHLINAMKFVETD